MRFDQLKTFLTVARTGSFSVAAKELETTQGTVSNHIAALEEYFGTELFKRTIKGVETTDAGKILKESAEKILEEMENAKAKISSAKHKLAGVIRIAASSVPGEHIIPSLITEFQKKHPDVKFRIKAEDSFTSLSDLQANYADFAAVGTIIGYEEKFDAIELGEEELVLIVSCNHELSKKKAVKLNEIIKYPYINREETSGTRKEIEKIFTDAKIPLSKLKTALELGSTESVITAVSEGSGISIISSIASKKAQAANLVKIVHIKDINHTRKLYMVRPKRKLLKTSEVFWEFCKEYTFKNVAVSCQRD
jgi:LysR family transcriptional regulator, transcriptional activator of the cysJI operon